MFLIRRLEHDFLAILYVYPTLFSKFAIRLLFRPRLMFSRDEFQVHLFSGTEATPNGSAAYADLDDQVKINRAPPKSVPDDTPTALPAALVDPPLAEPAVEAQPEMEEEATAEEDATDGGVQHNTASSDLPKPQDGETDLPGKYRRIDRTAVMKISPKMGLGYVVLIIIQAFLNTFIVAGVFWSLPVR